MNRMKPQESSTEQEEGFVQPVRRRSRRTPEVPGSGTARDEFFMQMAIREAVKAGKHGDVPIGCVIVYDASRPDSKADRHAEALDIPADRILGRGHNRRNKDRNALMHAEISAIRAACRKLQDWRVEDCTLYVTLEPCPMCAGAILQARIPRVVIGAMNAKAGCCGSVLDMLHVQAFNHRCEVRTGVLQADCTKLMTDFFRTLREEKG